MDHLKSRPIVSCPGSLLHGLGPAIIECHDYFKIAMRDHLNDTTTYKLLNLSEIECSATIVKKRIVAWLKTHHKILTKMERAFIRENSTQTKPHMQGFT